MSEEIRVSETNAATGETVVRVLEGAELEAFLADRAAMQAEQEAREAAVRSVYSSPDGEIGRHKRLKISRSRACRFDSGSGHQVQQRNTKANLQ